METTTNRPVETGATEISCQSKRSQFLSCLSSHFCLIKNISVEHKTLLERLLILSTKLNVIESENLPECLSYTEELICKVKGSILKSMNTILSKINQNMQQLSDSSISLRQNHETFIISAKAIDWENNSHFIKGSATEKPLFYYVEYSFDIMYCLKIYEKTLQFNILNLDMRHSSSMNQFLKNLSISQNLKDLITDVLINSFFICKTEKLKNKS